MEAFPFTDAEWEPVEEAVLALVNAGMADDDVLQASLRLEILDLLGALRERHGDHPFLLELVADYTEDDAPGRALLYRRALGIAEASGLPTFTIRLAIARLLLDVGEPATALEQLRSCEASLSRRDESERAQWAELFEEAGRAEPGATSDRC